MAKIGNLQSLSALAKAASNRKTEDEKSMFSAELADKKSKRVITVSLDDVQSKNQVRKQFINIEGLADTMKVEGQQSPVIVYPKNDSGKYVIQKGERRWRALRVAGIDQIDIIVNDKEMSSLDEVAGELIENIQREDLAPMEIANALKVFVSEGWKQVDIAKRLGKSAIFVSTHLSLLKLPDCVQNIYEKGICGDTETLNNLRLLFDLNEKKCKAICASATKDGITRKQSRDLLNDAKRVKEEAKKEKANVVVDPEEGLTNNIVERFESNEDLKGGDSSDQESTDDTAFNKSASHSTDDTIYPSDTENQIDLLKGYEADGTNEADDNKGGGEACKYVDPKKLVLSVNALIDDDVKSGILLLNRVCNEPSFVWVKVTEDFQEKDVLVLASDVELISMKGLK
ncbi:MULTISPECIES: ParB/RepB/Spo0J family partition protein [Marinomonas]|uniref:Chromosome partitioning protein, ParB family n=2 Tax=Marinomonas TaxID=28253 RepID=A0A1M5MZV7_9GAMM|nr:MULTISPECIES: ParB/RepB/Spo0J family partition protein [Marinomonas]RCW98316.1 ParB family chromosome partitioning protein [Marinomonas foliarum]SHG82767.1 chromosome partitioning protein, ParB family [Marinomonas polaris DSM 16579]|tara:strand:- start:4229 stop:5428 length:1200 start_codon:yes stop_codon:yes gene_type:complete